MGCVENILYNIEVNNFEKAMELILANVEKYKDDILFLKAEAKLCVKAKEYKTAINILNRVKKINPADMDTYTLLLEAYEKLEKKTDEENIIVVNSDNRTAVSYNDDLSLYKIRKAMSKLRAREIVPLVSIFFIAYNNLEKFTKPAIEAILKYTQNIDYELILLDNGSTDGTFSYFKELKYGKKKIIRITKNIGALYGQIQARKYCDGEFIAGVPNDVLVTKNWLDNMLACMQSDEKIGIVVPMSDYCSNFQNVQWEYSDFDDMQKKAAIFNRPDKRKWEERLRVIPTAFLIRQEAWILYPNDDAFIYNFSDDDLSFQYRRAGYKLMVCGDVFVHHEGNHMSGKDQAGYINDLKNGKAMFRKKYFGIDAWDDVLNFEEPLIELFPMSRYDGIAKVLGMDVRCGSPLLTFKNKMQKNDFYNIELNAFSTDAKYWLDLKTICNGEVICDQINCLGKHFMKKKFHYIILGEYLNFYDKPDLILNTVLNMLEDDGYFAVKIKNIYDVAYFQKNYSKLKLKIEMPSDGFWSDIPSFIVKENGKIITQEDVLYTMDLKEKEEFLNKVDSVLLGGDKSTVLSNVFIMEQLLIIQKNEHCN